MTPASDDTPPGPRAPRTGPSWGLRVGALVLALLLAVSVDLLAPQPQARAPAALGLVLLGVGLVPPRAWDRVPHLHADPSGGFLVAGVALLGIASVGVPLARYATLQGLLFLAVVGAPFLLLVTVLGRLDAEAAPRPRLPLGTLARRVGPLVGVAVALVLLPALFGPVRYVWTTDLAPTVSVLILAGASVALFAPLLVDRSREPRRLEAEPLDPERGTTVFEILRRRSRRP